MVEAKKVIAMLYKAKEIRELGQFMKIVDVNDRIHTLAIGKVEIECDKEKCNIDYGPSVITVTPPEGHIFTVSEYEGVSIVNLEGKE